ncbi:MAG: contact-dependent growth inhibition system immunity protein [Cyanobacteria bacterium J06639_1]
MDRAQSLEELEGDRWGEPTFPSRLARECYQLRRVPVKQLSAENLRLLVGQKVGLEYLIPVALDLLESDPLAGGDLYRGDLLQAVASVPRDFWASHPELRDRLVEIKIDLSILADTIHRELLPALDGVEFPS